MSKEVKPRSRKLFWIIAIILIATILFFSTRLYLAVNLILGNDIVVKLGADTDILDLKHGQSGEIKFNAYILSNPFCSAECISEFTDLSNQNIIETDNFTLTPAIIKSKRYNLTADKSGKGQDYYRFDIRCKGIKTFLCRTSDEARTRSILITLNYDLNAEEKQLKDNSKADIESLIQKANVLKQEISNMMLVSSNLSSLEINLSTDLKNNSIVIENSVFDLKKSWEAGNYASLPEKISSAITDIAILEAGFNESNNLLMNSVSSYNLLVDNLTSLKQRMEQLQNTNATNETVIKIDNMSDDFNAAMSSFIQKSSLAAKDEIVSNISSEILSFSIPAEENATYTSNKTLSAAPEKINLISISIIPLPISFIEPSPTCCLWGNCSSCCTDANCSDSNYPIILLHGHAFNKQISAEYSLETFQEIQDKLENDGYLNAGSVLISPSKEQGIWANINVPVSVRASYYFDVYQNPKESSIIQTKSDNLDSYALRMKDIVDIVKYKTGKSKVIIIAHSMGGLVARKYLDIFGSSSVDRLLMITIPNHGIESSICSVFGEVLECRDMAQDGLFLNKLNYAKLPNIPIYNIIGTGCKMGNETGDGVVTKDSAYLEEADNFEVTGSCDELKLQYFHNDILNPIKYPEVYQKIKELLKKK